MKRIMRSFKLNEISGVTVPAQAPALVAIMKRDATVRAIGKDNALLKKLGLLKNFGVNKNALADSIKSIVDDPEAADKGALVEETIKQFTEAVADDLEKTLAAQNADEPSAEDQMSAALAKSLGLPDTASVEEILAHVAATKADLAKAKADAEAVTKAAHDAELAKAAEANATMAKRLAALEGERELAKHEAKAEEIGLSKAHGEVLMKARANDVEAFGKLEAIIKGLNEQIRTGKVFAEFGDNQAGSLTDDPYAVITAKAVELQKANPKLTIEKAKAAVIDDRANAELVKAYRADRAAKIK